MASFKLTQGISRVPEDVFIEDGMTVTSGGLTVTAGTTTLGGSFIRDLVTLTATATLTNADHAGRIVSIGDEITLIDIASNQYIVKGILTASGTEATPFSASVS